jgi:hypothetical protein
MYKIGDRREVLCAADIYAANMIDIDVDAMGIPGPEGHLNAARGAEREKKIPYMAAPIGDGEKQKARRLSKKKGPSVGLEPTWM